MDILVEILFAVLSFMISSAVHEFGHVLTGLAEGFKFHLYVAGPFGLKRDENDQIVFYIEKDISLWGGIAATLPKKYDKENYKKFGRVLLGGPLTSILFGSINLISSIIFSQNILLMLGLMSLAIGTISLIPTRNGAFYTDGGRWLRIHKNEGTKAVELAIWNLTQNAIIQGNYTNVNLDEIMILKDDQDSRTQYLGHYFAYHFYKDNQEDENANNEKVALEELKGKVPKQMVTINVKYFDLPTFGNT